MFLVDDFEKIPLLRKECQDMLKTFPKHAADRIKKNRYDVAEIESVVSSVSPELFVGRFAKIPDEKCKVVAVAQCLYTLFMYQRRQINQKAS